MKQHNYFLSILTILVISTISLAQTARVQIIHNSADVSAEQVDIYLDDVILRDDFEFRTATAFQDVTANTPINIKVAPSNSTSSGDFVYELNTTLNANDTYILIANGIISTSGYTINDNFGIDVFNMAREAATNADNTDILFHHGSIDFEAVDVNQVPTTGAPVNLVNNLAYSEFSNGYTSLFSNTYTVNFTAQNDNSQVLTEYTLSLFPAFEGEAVTVIASGFQDPSANSNGEPFGVWLATAAGGPLTEIPPNALSTQSIDALKADVFPNPVRDYLSVNFEKSQNTTLSLFDIQGRKVLEQDLGLQNRIFLGDLNEGMYVLNLNNGFGSETMKIRKN